MADEIFQVYNHHSHHWCKMRSGKILDNSKEKYEGIPVRGPGKKKEDSSQQDSRQSDISSNVEQNDPDTPPAEKTEQVSDSEDSGWFF